MSRGARHRGGAAGSIPELTDATLEGIFRLITNAAGSWTRFPGALKRRFQGVMFPSGMTYGDDVFGTCETSPFIRLNVENREALSAMASPTGTATDGKPLSGRTTPFYRVLRAA